jgi:membrane-bound lytic murein transglycosylase D
MIPHAVKSLAAYSQTADARAARKQSRPHAGQRQAHVVKAGESLWSIARRYGVGVKQLAGWNAMAPGDLLSVGRELVVWTDHTVSAQAPEASNERIRRVTYTVRRGDSLYSIAQRFRIRVRELLQWNSISASRYLQPGQRLIMYVDVTKQST